MMNLTQYVGQDRFKPVLRAEIGAAKRSGLPFRHILLSGPPGVGKTQLAKILAAETGSVFVSYTADRSWTHAKVVQTFMRLDARGYGKNGVRIDGARYFVLIDECHLLPRWEPLYSILQDCEVSINGQVHWLPDLTVCLATTKVNLPKPALDRVPIKMRLDPYSLDEIESIIHRSYGRLPAADIHAIARRSRLTPRIALDFARSFELMGTRFFDAMQIDERGLYPLDRAYLDALASANRPMSLAGLSALLQEDKDTLEDNVEPYLRQIGLVIVTPQGRVLAEPFRAGNKVKVQAASAQSLSDSNRGDFSAAYDAGAAGEFVGLA